MSLPLNTHGKVAGGQLSGLFKILELREALNQSIAFDRCLIDLRASPPADLSALAGFGIGGAIVNHLPADAPLPLLHSLRMPGVVAPGDAVRIQSNSQVNVLYRRGANANSLFVTERCNSLCLMCSQPPRDSDDRWRVNELVELLPLIDKNLEMLGVTGGEPTLLGDALYELLSEGRDLLPNTSFHVLTNGRRFGDRPFADKADPARGRTIWAIPLYASVAHRHDFIVQSTGAFSETMHGLYNLAERNHRIEIRIVLHALTLSWLDELAEYIATNLPFVEHVALMGIEPMGLARFNRDVLYVEPSTAGRWAGDVASALHQRGVRVSIYNLPLCSLDRSAWPFAQQSISDWKNDFAEECEGCEMKHACCGFFRSADHTWRGSQVKPILGIAA